MSAALLASLATPAQAFSLFNRDNNYECSCEPLYCGAWGLQLQGGVRPIIWTNRGDLTLVNCTAVAPATVLTTVGSVPKFSRLFHTPWQIGGQLSYALSSNTNVFTEVNYAQARGKSSAVFANTNFGLFGLSKYKLVEWYVGTRYYTDRNWWCNAVSVFFGGKIGLIHHKTSGVTAVVAAAANDCCNSIDLFGRNTVFAGGGHVGLDYCYCGNWSFVLTAEVVASCAARSIGSARFTQTAINNLNLATNLIAGGIGTELAFPITVGVKYNF